MYLTSAETEQERMIVPLIVAPLVGELSRTYVACASPLLKEIKRQLIATNVMAATKQLAERRISLII